MNPFLVSGLLYFILTYCPVFGVHYSINNGDKIPAQVRCVGGELNLIYYENGKKIYHNTHFDLSGSDVLGNAIFRTLTNAEIYGPDYTYKIYK